MDIQLNTNKTSHIKWFLLLVLLACAAIAAAITKDDTLSVQRTEVTPLLVEQGELTLYSQAYGNLVPASEFMLTAQSSGRVKSVNFRAGAEVNANSVVLELENPELQQQLAQAKSQLESKKAELESFELEQKNQLLDYQVRIADIEAELERAQLDLDINQQLSERGVAAKIEIEKASLKVKQHTKRNELEKQKYAHFLNVQAFQLRQKQSELAQVEQTLALLTRQAEELKIRAGIEGRVQRLDIELGQSVAAGASLGLVGSDSVLKAQLRIPQYHADAVNIGNAVVITTKKGRAEGILTRIESSVNNGVVVAEAEIVSDLPVDARPALPVTAQVFIRHITDAVFVEQRPGLSPRSSLERFTLPASHQFATKQTIELGDSSQDKILVLSGVEPGDELIPIMREHWTHQDTLLVKNN